MGDDLIWAITIYCRHTTKVHRLSSYGLKWFFEQALCRYISNDEFKFCMALAGFRPTPQTKKENYCKYKVKFVGNNLPEEFAGDGYWFKKKGGKDGRI